MNGFKPVFVDVDPTTLSMSTDEVIKKMNKKTLAVFITHAQGFNGFTDKLLQELKYLQLNIQNIQNHLSNIDQLHFQA